MPIAKDIKPDLEELIKNISQKNMYSGNKIPDSIMKLFVVEERSDGAGIIVPYWIGVLERGRGPRLRTKDYKLYKIIKKWMAKRGMLKSKTAEGRDNEAKRMTWYINKYGNQQFNRGNPIFMDIYTTERKKTIAKIEAKIDKTIHKITMEVI